MKKHKKSYILPLFGAVLGGLLATLSVFAATVKSVSAPHEDLENVVGTSLPPTIFQSAFIALAPPVAPQNGYTIVSEHTLVITGYSSTVDQTNEDPFITASGKQVRWGIVATNLLPIGTKIRIPKLFGDEIFVVEDRMNRRYTNRVDIWFPSRSEAQIFGINNTKIEVMGEL